MPDNIIGHHNYVNTAAAIAACKQIGVPIKTKLNLCQASKVLANVQIYWMRCVI